LTDELLHSLISDQKNVPDIYKPGPYWKKKALSAIKELETNRLHDFRSSNNVNTAGTSFGDNRIIDARRIIEKSSLSHKIGLLILNHTQLKKLFDYQVSLTQTYFDESQDCKKNKLALINPNRFSELIQNYKIENSINFGCDSISKFNEKEYSTYYLSMLDFLDLVEKNFSLKKTHSILEIGPGFGANIHLIEQNYQNIRKFIVIDIVPNVWLVTEYLKSIYGNCVIDYLETKKMKEIKFKEDMSLEIFVIPPWEIEKISVLIDCFWNSNSFVEMPPKVVVNYAEHFKRIRSKESKYVFISYDKFDLKTTFNPDLILNFFPDVEFKKLTFPSFIENGQENYFYLGTVD